MRAFLSRGHHWLVMAERCVARSVLVLAGLVLLAMGLGLGATVVMLPIGIAFAVVGVGVVGWALAGDLPIEE